MKLNDESLVVIGVVQEQHAERSRLYKQWKQYDFPIAQDPFTKLGLAGVPKFIGIDEQGIVRKTNMRPRDLPEFIAGEYPKSDTQSKKMQNTDANEIELGDERFLFGKDRGKSIEEAIKHFRTAYKAAPKNGAILFRLGVAHRAKYDEVSHADVDFDEASRYWTMALATNPNQYIWRRRIEQYGPRMQKPYPFYDWIEQAQKEIRTRGEEPVTLSVSLSKSELAGRSEFRQGKSKANPDPSGKITRDAGQYVSIGATNVPATVSPGKSGTVHLCFSLKDPKFAKWNNEATPTSIWIEATGGRVSASQITQTNPSSASSTENRQMEFDFIVNKDANADCRINGFALYHICLADGTCIYRRQDFQVDVPSPSRVR